MRALPKIGEFCRREVFQTLAGVIVLLAYEEKRVAEVTFRKGSTEGVCCLDCVPKD